jgi:two-component system cell cycle sensor histidine kinase/response regulator CckA
VATILIADDLAMNREFLVTLLGYRGHKVLEARDGLEALEIAMASRPDLIITDIIMPRVDGYEFTRRLRNEPEIARTPIIFYTAHYREQEARELAERFGVSQVMTKPSDPGVILGIVETALSSPPEPVSIPTEEFARQYLRVTTDKLYQQVVQLELEVVERKKVEDELRQARDLL